MTGRIVIIGAGPAGLTAAHEVTLAGRACTVLERDSQPGGLARTVWRNGYGFDIGGHRFFTKSARVQAKWREILGDDFLSVRRLSRIYYNGRFFHYPLKPFNALAGLGLPASARVLASYLRRQVSPLPEEDTFEQYVTNRFGDRLYQLFFKAYTEKVWGMPCREIRADWAAQRIKGLSLGGAMRSAVFGRTADGSRSLVEEFHYPRLGPGMLWERMAEQVQASGSAVLAGREVRTITHDGAGRIVSVVHAATGAPGDAEAVSEEVDFLFNTMPLQLLLERMDPAPPTEVLDAARSLRYRDFVTVNLVLKGPNPFADQWVYIHSPEVDVGRIQNFKNWSADLVPAENTTGIGMEYFCAEGDELWSREDGALVELAREELRELGLAGNCEVIDGFVVRVPKAYPVYDADFARHVQVIQQWLEGFTNMHTLGRNGLHKYNNQDHSMLTAMHAVDNYLNGAPVDLWGMNNDPDYQEVDRDFETR